MQHVSQPARGPWIHRAAIRFFTVVLAVLIFWLLGFMVRDIGTLPGPDWSRIEQEHLDAAQVDRRDELQRQIAEAQRGINRLQDKQRILSSGSAGLKGTMDQLLEYQRLSIEKGGEVAAEDQQTFSDALQAFLANQDEYQSLNQELAERTENQAALQEELRTVEEGLNAQRDSAREIYNGLRRRHDLKVAAIKLAVLIPVLALAGVLLLKWRGRLYFPLVLALGGAVLARVLMVMHEHFPAHVFRYLLIGAALVVVIRILVHFLRTLAFPRQDWLVKQYREAYERFLCPVCEFPIRRGPMKYLYWTRRSIKKLKPPPAAHAEQDEGTYICPSCKTRLHESCPNCGKIRHALLPCCEHCGSETAGGQNNAS